MIFGNKLIMVTTLLWVNLSCMSHKIILDLAANQSMCITGKGPGQDGAINPYFGSPSYAIIKNIGNTPLSIRIQESEKLITTEEIRTHQKVKIRIEASQQLYFDSMFETKVELSFKKAN